MLDYVYYLAVEAESHDVLKQKLRKVGEEFERHVVKQVEMSQEKKRVYDEQ